MKTKIIWILGTVLIIGGLLYWIYRLKEGNALLESKQQTETAAAKVDSLTQKQNSIIDTIKQQSQNGADRATKLIKNLPNEKITIKDTTYSAMCDYITNYRPD